MKTPNKFLSYLVTTISFALIPITLIAGESSLKNNNSSSLEDLWDIPQLYSDSDSSLINDLKLVGRYQWQYADLNSDQGDWSDSETRRFRLGTEAKVFGGDWKLKGEINVNDDFSPFYKSLEEAYIKYQGNDALNVTIGKQKVAWSYEWSTSSRKILTFERSLLVNQLAPKKTTGISASGSIENWSYILGIYNGNIDEEFGDFDDSGEFALASIGYDYSKDSDFDKAAWRLDLLHRDEANNAAKPYKNSISLNHSLSQGAITLNTDLIHAGGYSDDAYGIVLLPTYDISDKLQLVARYTYASSDGDSLRAQKRYERKASLTNSGYGEDYQSYYLGLNYYINDHKLKLMTGIEYADMNGGNDGGDYSGWTLFSGLRLYF
ncbi:MAG: OprO/OprP family phosphate-selective porin [Verrucomicrobiales bacterium]|nr:OprO/OprP family phosphate-selective porin [Verrucomicrobiales bacterium]